jgi:protein-tyrosine phosphatase
MSYKFLFPGLGFALTILGLLHGGWFCLAFWVAADFFILGLAHGRGWHRIFGKRPDGALSWWSWLLFLPLLLLTWTIYHVLRRFSREPACNTVSDTLVVGRRLLPAEVDGQFDNYVDLTAEFTEPSPIRRAPSYRSFPILDGAAPTPEALRAAVASLRPGRTFVHCAQGHGRTALFALAMLLSSGEAQTVEAGLRRLTRVRPAIRLSRAQRRCIEAFAQRAR